MFGRKLRFRLPEGGFVSDPEHIEEYNSSPATGRVRLGKSNLYYRDLGKKYCVPYEYIERAFTRISECPENEFANSEEYYRLILVHGTKEFANLIFENIEDVKSLEQKLKEINPAIEIGARPEDSANRSIWHR